MIRSLIFIAKWFLILLSFFFLLTIENAYTEPHDNKKPKKLIAFAPKGELSAQIIITHYGVPHIKADNLESLAFGNGYSQAKDNLCLIADEFVRVNSERSKYFGPDKAIKGDTENIISDFGFKALGIRELAEKKWPDMSDNAKALILGFTQGYNYYLNELKHNDTDKDKRDPLCKDKLWVKPISITDVMTRIFTLSIIAGSSNFFPQIFFANPGDETQWQPYPLLSQNKPLFKTNQTIKLAKNKKPNPKWNFNDNTKLPNFNKLEIGSNGWALGKNLTKNSNGILLSNTHFPHFGMLRFWQWHAIIPGVMNTMGASALGVPGVINIGFNQNIAWTHTFSAAEHFIVYRLALVPGNRMRYFLDGVEHTISSKKISIAVKTETALVTLEKEIFYTKLGIVIEANSVLPWDDTQAYVIKDINLGNTDSIDHWLAMNKASNLDEFKQAFKDYDGVIFNNTLYSDKKGKTYYIDDSTVPELSQTAINLINTNPDIIAARKNFGFTILPGHLTEFIFTNAVPYVKAPKIERSDYVQNSNDSYWATNLNSLLENFSPLYGGEKSELSLRTRMSLKMLHDSTGEDRLFSLDEVESALLSNRAYLPEMILTDLISLCHRNSNKAIQLNDSITVDINDGCQALEKWDGSQNKKSIAGHLIREFSFLFSKNNYYDIPFDPLDPENTPRKLINDDAILFILANAIKNIEAAGWKVDDKLGDIMFIERTLANGQPSKHKIPWSGAHDIEGGFNIFSSSQRRDNSIFAKHNYPTAKDVLTGNNLESQLTSEGYQIRFGSGWIMIVGFDDEAPQARGLLTYSQSININSKYYNDQTRYYSDKGHLRSLNYTTEDINDNTVSSKVIHYKR